MMIEYTEDEIAAARNCLALLTEKISLATRAANAEYACGVVEGYLKALGDFKVLPWAECNRMLLIATDAAKTWKPAPHGPSEIVSDYDPLAPERQ